MADIDFRDYGENLIAAARNQFQGFLAENKEVDDLVLDIGRSYGIRMAEYLTADTEEEREAARVALRRVRNTMDLTMDGMAHLVKSEILTQLKAALGMTLEFAIQNLPTVLKMIRK